MVVRRGERDWGSIAYDNDGMTTDDLLVESHLSLFDEDPLFELKLNLLKKCARRAPTDRPAPPPVTTNFGPASITEFFRTQIAKALTDGRLGKGKGEEPVRDDDEYTEKYTEVGIKSHKQPTSPLQDRKSTPRKPGRLTLADDALLHLRGQGSTQDASATSDARTANQLSDTISPQPSSGNETPTRRRIRSSGRRPRTHSRQSSQSSMNVAADASRRLDFAQHTELIRNRTRSRSVVEPVTVNTVVSEYPELPLVQANPLRNPFSVDTSDDVQPDYAALFDGAEAGVEPDDMFVNATDSFEEESRLYALTQAAVSDPRSEEVPTEDRWADPGLDANDLGYRLSLDSDGDDEDLTSLSRFINQETDPFGRVNDDSHPRYLKAALQSVAKVVNIVKSTRGLASGMGDFDYAVVVPSKTPRLVTQDRTPSKEDQKPVPKSASTFTSPLRNRIRRSADADDAHALSRDRIRGPKPSPTKPSGKFFITNDVFDRVWDARPPPVSRMAPPICEPDPSAPPRNANDGSDNRVLPFNYDVWADVVQYLSFDDIQNLRGSCKGFAAEIAPIMLRSVVTKFGKSMFTTKPDQLDAKKDSSVTNSVLAKYGHEIHKFGIAFEYDWMGLAYAAPKVTEKREQAWYGSYRWPVETYPRYSETQELEDLVDNNRPLLKDSIGFLTGVSELALCIDSGHGWLDGPDISDLELYEKRRMRGDKVFGQAFPVENIWHAFGRSELFKWGQMNSVNEALKFLSTKPDIAGYRRSIMDMKKMIVRDIEDFVDEKSQPDYDPHSHTGGFALPPPPQNQIPAPGQMGPGANQPLPMYINGMNGQAPNPVGLPNGLHAAIQQARLRTNARPQHTRVISDGGSLAIPMQWPLIFSGYNLAGDVGGRNQWIQKHVPSPSQCPLIPGHLTEAQVQWLMESLWAQRVFLSSYTTAIITHKQKLSKVHTLTIAKISSGLLPSLAQKEFWSSLTGLKRLKVLVSPDWRNEHIPGDKFFAAHMPMSPVTAASKFAEFLRTHITKLENLSHLTVGYIGGGEHATGLFARNQHLLPAPITSDPRLWISDHVKKPDPATIFAFNHIRDLTFENCWFSPCMLEIFMEKSRDTSLHTLVLDSVSMLARQASGIDGSLQTIRHGLRCQHNEEDWLHEEIPASATWTDVLDKITPGVTMLERKYASGMIDSDQQPIPPKDFRGNVQKIVLKSCGYAKISGVKGDELNQNALVVHSTPAIDVGLLARKRLFEKYYGPCAGDDDNSQRDHTGPGAVGRAMADMRARAAKDTQVMMSMNDTKGDEWFGLGTLTQCVHPVEKRILEKAWGMTFGWGNDLARWTAMEDGFFESGTGRFSGVVGGEKVDSA